MTYIDKIEFDSTPDFFDRKNKDIVCAVGLMTKRDLNSNKDILIDRFDEHLRLHGIVWPQQIIIADSYKLDDLKYFILCVGGLVVWKIPVQFIIKLFPPTIIDSKYHIHLPGAYFYYYCQYWSETHKTIYSKQKMETLPNKYIDMINENKIFGLPIFSFEYHETKFKLVTSNPIKYDLNFESMYLSLDCKTSLTKFDHGIISHVNIIHEVTVNDINELNFQCCDNLKTYISNNSPIDLRFFINYIHDKRQSIDENILNGMNPLIDIGREIKKIRTMYIKKETVIISPLCQIIADYTDNSHSGSYAEIQNDGTIKLYLYLENNFLSMNGMGGLEFSHCDQIQKDIDN